MSRRRAALSRATNTKDFELEMTPMIDVTFLLLIFFMCTLKFKSLEGQLTAFLPRDEGVNREAAELPEPLEVGIHLRVAGRRLTPDGRPWAPGLSERWVYGAERRVDYSIGPRRGLDLQELRASLVQLDPRSTGQTVILAPGEGTVQAEAIAVLDLLLDCGLEQVRIRGATQR